MSEIMKIIDERKTLKRKEKKEKKRKRGTGAIAKR